MPVKPKSVSKTKSKSKSSVSQTKSKQNLDKAIKIASAISALTGAGILAKYAYDRHKHTRILERFEKYRQTLASLLPKQKATWNTFHHDDVVLRIAEMPEKEFEALIDKMKKTK
jgi:hypothetical protein